MKITKKEIEEMTPHFKEYGISSDSFRFVSFVEMACIFRKSRRPIQNLFHNPKVKDILGIEHHLDCHAQIRPTRGGGLIKLYEFNSILQVLKLTISSEFRPNMGRCANHRYVNTWWRNLKELPFLELFNAWINEREITSGVESDYNKYKKIKNDLLVENLCITNVGESFLKLNQDSSHNFDTLCDLIQTLNSKIDYLQEQIEKQNSMVSDVYSSDYKWTCSNGKDLNNAIFKSFHWSDNNLLEFVIDGQKAVLNTNNFCPRNPRDIALKLN